jgi:putative serine protease PepD
MPDFAFQGKGVRIGAVTEGSPAAAAGLKVGDVLKGINESPIEDLRGFSDLLKTFAPGDRVTLQIERGDETLSVEVTLAAR